MSFRNAHYEKYAGKHGSVMHLWHIVDGKNVYETFKWAPYVFVPTIESDIKALDGTSVIKKDFSDYKSYYNFVQSTSGKFYENAVKPETQFLAERYYTTPDHEMEIPNLLTYVIDIEVYKEDGFPEPEEAQDPITAFAIRNSKTKKVTIFGLHPWEYDGDILLTGVEIEYHYCRTEEILLKNALQFIHDNPPDVISGWHVQGFDLLYIIYRARNLFHKDQPDYPIEKSLGRLLSPIGIIKVWDKKVRGGITETFIDIAGVTVIDYLRAYKKFTRERPGSYKLDIISKLELGEGKLEYEAKDLRELYKTDWNTYVKYNIVDTMRVGELDEKLGYISLIQSLSLISKCPMKYYEATTAVVEGLFITYYRRNNKCATYYSPASHSDFKGAEVKATKVGFHEWVAIMDITSSYPTAMITLNMGIESFYGKIESVSFTEDFKEEIEITGFTDGYVPLAVQSDTADAIEKRVIISNRKREYPPFVLKRKGKTTEISGESLGHFNEALKKGYFSIAPNGAIFWNNKDASVAQVTKYVFGKRKEVKKIMINEKDKVKKDQYNVMQNSLKIIINSIYGAIASPYYRDYKLDIANAVTAVGRHSISMGEKFINEHLNQRLGTTNRDFVIAIDTDSLQASLEPILKEKIMDEAVALGWETNAVVNERSYKETQLIDYCSNPTLDFRVNFAFEVIARTGLWVATKKYGCWIKWKEGKEVDSMKVVGLEIVRSDTPDKVKKALKNILDRILRGAPDNEIKKLVFDYKEIFEKLPPEDIANNIGINDVGKYVGLLNNSDEMKVWGGEKEEIWGIKKGTGYHMKGVANYRALINSLGLSKKYPDIKEREKSKAVYLKKNKYGFKEITFPEVWPQEFTKNGIMVDNKLMVEKGFIKKILMLLGPMKKTSLINENSDNVDHFF